MTKGILRFVKDEECRVDCGGERKGIDSNCPTTYSIVCGQVKETGVDGVFNHRNITNHTSKYRFNHFDGLEYRAVEYQWLQSDDEGHLLRRMDHAKALDIVRPLERVEMDEWAVDLQTLLVLSGNWKDMTDKETACVPSIRLPRARSRSGSPVPKSS